MKKQTEKVSKSKKLFNITKTIIEKFFLALVAFALVYLFVKSLHEEELSPQAPEAIIEFEVAEPEFIYQEDDEIIVIESEEYDIEGLNEIISGIESEPDIAAMIKEGVSFDLVQPQEAYFDKIYELYEEDLPTNVIDDGRKKIRDVKVSPARKPAYFGKQPVIAVIIDDMGISQKRTNDINSLRAPLTSSFLTYAQGLKKQIKDSINAGHEVIAHIPMESKVKKDVAPVTLGVDMSKEEIQETLSKMLDRFDGVKGVNNHMGSKFTENLEHMGYIMEVLKDKDLFFLDSKTSSQSKGRDAAAVSGVRYAVRNVFLDNNNDYDYIMGQLKIAERLALKNGYAIAIAHPKSQTYLALKDWLGTLEGKGLKLVHLSEIVYALNDI